MVKTVNRIDDFVVLQLAIPAGISFPKSFTHYLFIKSHSPAIETTETPRSLFLTNVPVDTTITHLRRLFSTAELGGPRIEGVEFEDTKPNKLGSNSNSLANYKSKKRKRNNGENALTDLPSTWDREICRSGSTAVVVFIDRANKEIALKASRKLALSGRSIPWPNEDIDGKIPALGSSRYKAHFTMQFPRSEHLEGIANAYMESYDSAEQARVHAVDRTRNMPDEDGFVTVTRGAKLPQIFGDIPRTGNATGHQPNTREKKHSKKSEGLEDFYRFQNREKKKLQQNDLVQQFERERKTFGQAHEFASGRSMPD